MTLSHCDAPVSDAKTQPVVGQYTFQEVAQMVGGGMGALTVLLMLVLIVLHGCYYTRRPEQKQIVRIFLLPIGFVVFYVLSIVSYKAAPYLEPLPHLFEAIAICAFWELMTSIAINNPASYNAADSDDTQYKPRAGFESEAYNVAALDMKNALSKRVYQLPPVIFILIIIAEIVTGSTCPTSTSYHRLTLAIQVVRTLSTVAAVLAILRFFKTHKSAMLGRRIGAKLLIFKGLVGVSVLQSLIFSILKQRTDILEPTESMSWNDWHHGLPSLLLACYCPIFALLFAWAFSPAEYSRMPRTEGGNVLTALGDAVNLVDMVLGMAGGLLGGRRQS